MIFYVVHSMPNTYLSDKYMNSVFLLKDNWDDWFRFETNYLVYYLNNGKRYDIGSVKIGQSNMEENQRSANLPQEFTSLPEEFFSLGQSDFYYNAIKELGDSFRIEFLTALNDVAYNLTIYEKTKHLDVMRISLMREVPEYMLKQQFHRIAKGNVRLTEYNIEYTYPKNKMENPPILTFNVIPESNPPTNVQVIIGRNNVGKTYLIKNIIKAIYNETDSEEFGRLQSTDSTIGQSLDIEKQAFSNLLCVSFSPFDNYQDILKLTNKNTFMPFHFIGLSNGDLNEIICKDFCESLDNCQKSNRKIKLLKDAFQILSSDPIFEQSKISSYIHLHNKENEDEKESAEKIFKLLSSGHQVVILTLFKLVERITEKSLVILDEPENHLHPPLLSAFIRALSNLLIDQNGVAIIATHSPVILQEVPKSCVWKINRFGNEVSASRLEIESFGSTIGALTRDVFGLEVTKSGFHKLLLDEVQLGLSYEEIISKFNNELGDEARAVLITLLHEKHETS